GIEYVRIVGLRRRESVQRVRRENVSRCSERDPVVVSGGSAVCRLGEMSGSGRVLAYVERAVCLRVDRRDGAVVPFGVARFPPDQHVERRLPLQRLYTCSLLVELGFARR